MIKVSLTVILLFFLVSAHLSLAQEPSSGIKIYSGYLHRYVHHKMSFLHAFFSGASHQQEEILRDKQCSIEFKSPVPFSHQSVAVIPEELSYFVRFKNDLQSPPINSIKIYTNDEEEYSIDPVLDGKIFDSYLIYLILGTDINHIEIVSSSGDDKYVLDKLEIRDNH